MKHHNLYFCFHHHNILNYLWLYFNNPANQSLNRGRFFGCPKAHK